MKTNARYKMKREMAEWIDKTYKREKFVDELDFGRCYLSLIFCGKKTVPKNTAFAITKCIGYDKEIEDFFDEV